MNNADNDLIICRCEEVSKKEIHRAIDKGATTLWQIRRITRCGLGLCQGRSCERLTAKILADEIDQPLEAVLKPSHRPPVQPVTVDVLASGERIVLE